MQLEELISKGADDEESVKKEINLLKTQKENLIKDPSILVQDRDSNEFGYCKKRKKPNEDISYEQSKKPKCTFDDYSEEYLVYCAERTLTIFSKYSKELSSTKKEVASLNLIDEYSQQKAMYCPLSSCYMPTFQPYINHVNTPAYFKYSNESSMQMTNTCNEYGLPLDFTIFPIPYVHSYQPKHQPDNASPHIIKILLNEEKS